MLASPIAGAQEAVPPDPAVIKQTIAGILQQPAYDLDLSSRYRLDLSWLIQKLFSPLFEFFEWLNSLSPYLGWPVVVVLTLILVVLIVHIVYTFVVAIRAPYRTEGEIPLDTTVDADALKTEAERLAAQGDYVDASRVLFRAALVMLETKRGGRMLAGLTNTEYLHTFRSTWVIENLRVFVELINWKWYRDNSFDAGDYARCRAAFDAIEMRLAQGA